MSNSSIDFIDDVPAGQEDQYFIEKEIKKIKQRMMFLIFITYLLMPIVSIIAFVLKLLDVNIFIIVAVISLGLVIQLLVVYFSRRYFKRMTE